MSETQLSTSRLFLAIASVLYLITEIVFNASLLEVVSRVNIEPDTFHFVEEFGRIASSTGFTLFVLGLFVSTGFIIKKNSQRIVFLVIVAICVTPFLLTTYNKEALYYVFFGAALVFFASKINEFKGNVFISIIGITLMSWFAFYYGKVAITDYYIVDKSSGEERLASKYTSLLKKALIVDAVQLEDIALKDLGGAETPESKAFLAMLGPLSTYTKGILSWIEDDKNTESIIRTVLSSKDIINIDVEYNKYLSKRNKFKQEVYIPYANASKKYLERHEAIDNKAKKAWSGLVQDIDNGYEKYKQSETDFKNKFADIAVRHGFGKKLSEAREYWRKCGKIRFERSRSNCYARIKQRYSASVKNLPFNTPSDFRDFYGEGIIEPVTTTLNTVVGVLNNILSLRLDEDPEIRINKIYLSLDNFVTNQKIGEILAENNQDKFKNHPNNTAGLLFGLSKYKYKNSPKLPDYIRLNLNSRYGIKLPEGWRLSDYKVFYQEFITVANKNALQKWRQKTVELFKGTMKPGLSMNQLTLMAPVQTKLKNELDDMYVKNIIFSWSEKEYVNKVINPLIEKRIKKEIASFKVNAKQYENGGSKEKEGKDLFRSQIIPPIAIALSLIFSLISMFKVVPFLSKKLTAVLVFSVLIIPPFVLTNHYAESEAWKVLSTEVKKEAPIITYMTEYVIRIEPLLFDLGKSFLNLLNVQF